MDGPEAAVISLVAEHLIAPHPPDRLGQNRAARDLDPIQGDIHEDLQFRPQICEEFFIEQGRLFARRAAAKYFGDDFREGDEAVEGLGQPRSGAIRKLVNPVEDAYGEGPAAYGTNPFEAEGLFRTEPYPQLRCPSRWYFPSSGKNSMVPANPVPVFMA